MMQPKRRSLEDPISLEGFEALLDRFFERQIRLSQDASMAQVHAPDLLASNNEKMVSGHTAPELAVTAAALQADVRLLTARLEYAFEALAQSRFKEKALQAKVASMEDQLQLVPDLLSKAARLNELEDYLRGLATRLSNRT